MDRYVDGFVLPVPTDQLDEYRAMATEAGELWMEHGALAYFEGVGDDLDPETGGMTIRRFPDLADTAEDESVVFAYIVFESREHRDEVNAKVMDDPAMAGPDPDSDAEVMPFDMERMAYAGFRSLVSFER